MDKTFKIDWDSLDEVRGFFNQAKSRFFELNRIATHTPSRHERNRKVLEAASYIWGCDISGLYEGLDLDERKRYYVYAHLDTTKKIAIGFAGLSTFAATLGMGFFPFYVGKGTGDRCSELNRNETHRKVRERIQKFGKAPEVFQVKKGLTESEALQYEAKLVDIFGLVTNKGYLTNLDEGLSPEKRRSCYPEQFRALARVNRPLIGYASMKSCLP
jgi:hypothetical protein